MDINSVESIPIVIDSKSSRHPIAIETVKFLRRHVDNPIFVISNEKIDVSVPKTEWILRAKDCFPLRNISDFANNSEFPIVMPWPDDNFLESINNELLKTIFVEFCKDSNTGFFKLHTSSHYKVKKYNNDISVASRKNKWYIDVHPFWVKLNYLTYIASVKIKSPWEMERQAVRRARSSSMRVMVVRKDCYKIHNFIKRGYVLNDAYNFAKEEGLDFSDMDLRFYRKSNKSVYKMIRKGQFKILGPKLLELSKRRARHKEFKDSEIYMQAFHLWKKGKYKRIAPLIHETHTKCEWD